MPINKQLREKYIEIIITRTIEREKKRRECMCDRQPPQNKYNNEQKNE
jgi:hypothetical protein